MDRKENPYRPGFNEPPKELAGREAVLEDLTDAIEVAALEGRTPRPTMIVGARGVGKTVLLAQAAAIAGSQFGWPRVHTEMRPDTPFIPDLIDAIGRTRDLVEQPPSKRALKTESVTLRAGVPVISGEVRFARGADSAEDPTPALRPALTGLAELAIARETGFVLTLDEAHLASRRELAALAALLQEGTGERWPVVVVIAGLPLMRAPEHSVTYLERGAWHELGLLSSEETVRALRLPAEAGGKTDGRGRGDRPRRSLGWLPLRDPALRPPRLARLTATTGSTSQPHRLLFPEPSRSSKADSTPPAGARRAQPRSATSRPSRPIAGTATPTTARAVAEELGRTPKQLSSVRDDLIKAGTLTVEGDELRFTIPGMGAYMLAR